MVPLADLRDRREQERWISAINLWECLACLKSLTFQFNDQQEELGNRWPASQSLSSISPLVCLYPCRICPYGYLVTAVLALRVHRGDGQGWRQSSLKAKVTTLLVLYCLYCCFFLFNPMEQSQRTKTPQTCVVYQAWEQMGMCLLLAAVCHSQKQSLSAYLM